MRAQARYFQPNEPILNVVLDVLLVFKRLVENVKKLYFITVFEGQPLLN